MGREGGAVIGRGAIRQSVRARAGNPDLGASLDYGAARSAAAATPSLPARLLLVPIRLYQRFISPALPPACRFTPTCSQYAVEAIARHGALRGGWLAARRLGRCHPWHPGGPDPVP